MYSSIAWAYHIRTYLPRRSDSATRCKSYRCRLLVIVVAMGLSPNRAPNHTKADCRLRQRESVCGSRCTSTRAHVAVTKHVKHVLDDISAGKLGVAWDKDETEPFLDAYSSQPVERSMQIPASAIKVCSHIQRCTTSTCHPCRSIGLFVH